MARPMRIRAFVSARFSRREMVSWEHRSAPPGSRSQASLKAGSRRRLSASLPSSYPQAIIIMRNRMMSAKLCRTRSTTRSSRRQAANLSAIPSRLSTSRRANTPMSEDRLPPSKRASISLAETGGRPGRSSVVSRMAGVVPLIGEFRCQQPKSTSNQWLGATPASWVNFPG